MQQNHKIYNPLVLFGYTHNDKALKLSQTFGFSTWRISQPPASYGNVSNIGVLGASSGGVRTYVSAKRSRNMIAVILLFLASVSRAIGADIGIGDKEIIFGQSTALAGPASSLGSNMRDGILAAFSEQNEQGGIYGRMLKLVSYNDNYEPKDAIYNTLKLIDEKRVFALIGSVGTPTSIAVAPIAQERGVPFIGPFTGAAALRNKEFSTVINLRASYAQEAEFIVKWLVDQRHINRIAVLYQDDSFGKAGLQGVISALKVRNLSLVGRGSYERNTIAVKRALLEIERGTPQAIIMVSAYAPAATFIQWARKLGMKSQFICLSFVGTNALSTALANGVSADITDVFVSQVVPVSGSAPVQVVEDYKRAFGTFFPTKPRGFISLEGYLVGRMTIAALKRAGKNLNRQIFLDAILSSNMDLGGFDLRFTGNSNQGSNQVFLTSISNDGRVDLVEIDSK